MSTDTRHLQYDDAILQAAMDAACQEITLPGPSQCLDLRPKYNTWSREATARLALARGLLARLPEPPPPVNADGKTPGELLYNTMFEGCDEKVSWAKLLAGDKALYERAASAVLAAFGVAGLEAQAKLDYVHNMGLRFGMMFSSDKTDPYLAHTWAEDSDHERMFREWSASIGEKSSLEAAIARMEAVDIERLRDAFNLSPVGKSLDAVRACLIAAAREVQPASQPAAVDWKQTAEYWSESYKFQQEKLLEQQARAEKAEDERTLTEKLLSKAEAELAMSEAAFSNYRGLIVAALNEAGAPTHHPDIGAPARKPMTPQERIKALCGLSTLRPIAEAGEVPAGAVRYFFQITQGCSFSTGTLSRGDEDTHFADILLPEAKAPAVEAAKAAETDKSYAVCAHLDCPQKITHYEGSCPTCTAKPADTFEAHSKTWNVHVPGDERPCDGRAKIDILDRNGTIFSNQAAHHLDLDFWTAEYWNPIIGWRYADEPSPLPAPPPWQPAVGEPVRLVSGGPEMTVTHTDGDNISVAWFSLGEVNTMNFPAACLVPAKEAQP